MNRLLIAILSLLPTTALAYGEKVDSYPSLDERQIHLFTDMLRVDPMAFWDGEGEYSPVRPLIYNFDLNRAAFAHAFDMNVNDCFQHESCDGTPMQDRVDKYYSGYVSLGENIAMGYESSYRAVFSGWLYSDGHRANMLSNAFNELGTGYDEDGSAEGRWYVQDFGRREGLDEPYLTSGSHWPDGAPEGDVVTFATTFYHPDGFDPQRVWLALDEECHEMDLDVGQASFGAYAWALDVTAEVCLPYSFVATLENGEDVSLPTEGALVLATGGAICDDYQDEPPHAPCSSWVPPDAGGCSPASCNSGVDEDVVIENDNEDTGYGTCSQMARPVRPYSVTLAAGALLLAWRRLIWSRRRRAVND